MFFRNTHYLFYRNLKDFAEFPKFVVNKRCSLVYTTPTTNTLSIRLGVGLDIEMGQPTFLVKMVQVCQLPERHLTCIFFAKELIAIQKKNWFSTLGVTVFVTGYKTYILVVHHKQSLLEQ